MRVIDLETRVITAVDRIRAGQKAESDLVECKRTWPRENKARQLAGSLNRAGGDPVVYIIGIDEDTGDVHDVSGTDVLDWWNQIVPKFDQAPPEMIRHIPVAVGAGGEHVVALAFSSDRAPYLVKTGSANPSLEVPMREGTGTRSARRDELLRMLIPAVRLPQTVLLKASLETDFQYTKADDGSRRIDLNIRTGGHVHCYGEFRFYVEHQGSELVTLPRHGMHVRVIAGGRQFEATVSLPRTQTEAAGRNLVVSHPREGVVLGGPGVVSIPFGFDLRGDVIDPLRDAIGVSVEVELEVLHAASKPLKLVAALQRTVQENLNRRIDTLRENRTIGSWEYLHPTLDLS